MILFVTTIEKAASNIAVAGNKHANTSGRNVNFSKKNTDQPKVPTMKSIKLNGICFALLGRIFNHNSLVDHPWMAREHSSLLTLVINRNYPYRFLQKTNNYSDISKTVFRQKHLWLLMNNEHSFPFIVFIHTCIIPLTLINTNDILAKTNFTYFSGVQNTIDSMISHIFMLTTLGYV